MSVKYQITLPDDLAFRMRETTRTMKIPLAQFIRQTMEEKLDRLRNPVDDDPFASIRGLVDADLTDGSTRVDEVVASRICCE
jgi:hypothetical protein